ncbi:hypothetical protein DPV78_010801 [Talaromyces pinophilus]|nr:hypothetical protein DPV78_010801 [Talaromyces pinophilus]
MYISEFKPKQVVININRQLNGTILPEDDIVKEVPLDNDMPIIQQRRSKGVDAIIIYYDFWEGGPL